MRPNPAQHLLARRYGLPVEYLPLCLMYGLRNYGEEAIELRAVLALSCMALTAIGQL